MSLVGIMDIEKLIESVNPKNNRERRKLRHALSQVRIDDLANRRIVRVPRGLLGVLHKGDWYSSYLLSVAERVEIYEKRIRSEASCVRDRYGRYWYHMNYDDTIYDDVHFVFIEVQHPDEAEALYRKIGVDTYSYIVGSQETNQNPYFCWNTSGYMWYHSDDLHLTQEEYMLELVENNDILVTP